MFLLRPIIVMCMQYWIEDRAARRKEEDADRIKGFQRELRSKYFRKQSWEDMPQRLRGRILRSIPMLLEEAADKGDCDLPRLVNNARQCTLEIPPEEVSRLLELAMYKAGGAHQITLAKWLHGDPLPLDVLLDLAKKTGEDRGWPTIDGKEIDCILEEVRATYPEALPQLLQVIAQQGRYNQLRRACTLTEMNTIPTPLLHTCMRAQFSGERHFPAEIANMCIALQDWEFAEELLMHWQKKDNLHTTRAMLALAMHDAKQKEEHPMETDV